MVSDLLLKGSKVLNKQEMKNVTGGVTAAQHCATLQEIAGGEYAKENWTSKEWDSWTDSFLKHCTS